MLLYTTTYYIIQLSSFTRGENECRTPHRLTWERQVMRECRFPRIVISSEARYLFRLLSRKRWKPWKSLWDLPTAMPLVEFHHRLTACPSYRKKRRTFRLAASSIMISDRFLPFSYVSAAICQTLPSERILRHGAWAVSFPSKC